MSTTPIPKVLATERYCGIPGVNGGRIVNFGKKHIYLDVDVTNAVKYFNDFAFGKDNANYIHKDHRIHMFFSSMNECISNGKIYEFIEKCRDATDRRVIIHIPKKEYEMGIEMRVQLTLRDLDNCDVIIENQHAITKLSDLSYGGKIMDVYVTWNNIIGKEA